MGIRYYAYAFENDQTERVVADPRRFISDDPLADAWGIGLSVELQDVLDLGLP